MENLAHDRMQLNGTDRGMTKILIVDDEQSIRRLLERTLDLNGYNCTLAGDAAEARTLMEDQNPDLILCDVGLPGESGIDFIRYTLSEYPETAVVMVSARGDPEIVDTAMQIGVYGYIVKPFEPTEVLINVNNALRRRNLEIHNRLHREKLEKLVIERTETLQKILNDLQKAMTGIVEAMGLTVETRDPYTAGHQKSVAEIACAIATEMGLPEGQIDGVRMAGVIHDIGKISVPAEILSKPGRINEHEFGMIKSHPQVGYNIRV